LQVHVKTFHSRGRQFEGNFEKSIQYPLQASDFASFFALAMPSFSYLSHCYCWKKRGSGA